MSEPSEPSDPAENFADAITERLASIYDHAFECTKDFTGLSAEIQRLDASFLVALARRKISGCDIGHMVAVLRVQLAGALDRALQMFDDEFDRRILAIQKADAESRSKPPNN